MEGPDETPVAERRDSFTIDGRCTTDAARSPTVL